MKKDQQAAQPRADIELFDMLKNLPSFGLRPDEHEWMNEPEPITREDRVFEKLAKETMRELEPITREDRLFEKFAKETMRELVEHQLADFVLLRNEKLRKWWQKVVDEELAVQKKREADERHRMLKEQALSKLSDEEKEALGFRRTKK